MECPSRSVFCEVLRSFSHSEARTLYFLIPRRKTTVVAKTSSVHPGLFFARCCDHFAFRRHYNLFPNTSKEEVAKTWRSFFCEVLRSFSHSEGTTIYFPIPQRKTVVWSLKQSPVFCEVLRSFSSLHFISQYLEGRLYCGR